VSVSVCLSARVSQKSHVRYSPNRPLLLPVAVARFFSGGVAICYVLCTSGFAEGIMLARNNREQATRKGVYSKLLVRWQNRFDTVPYTQTNSPEAAL